MNIDILNEAIGNIDPAIVEAALSDEAVSANAIPFARRPWMKRVAVAAAFIVVVAGALVAINVTGAWRNGNLVPPNSGNETPGVIASTGSDSGEPDGSSAPDSENPGSEGTPAISDNSSSQNGENSGSENHGGQGSETPGKPDGTQTPPAEEPEVVIEGDFMKDNMPAVTYRIAGENKTFVYQKSSVVKTSEVGDGKPTYSVIDRYADHDGATISVDADSGDLMRYDAIVYNIDFSALIDVGQAIEKSKHIALNTDINLAGIVNATVSAMTLEEGYNVSLTVADGSVEVGLNNMGGLLYLTVTNNA
ncbi:MAG: hypothetical protein IJU94_07025 [Clostridia bacterium]|nr:hypothetical protein [Clostridia bacterium]